MPYSKLRSGWDTQGALKRKERDPAFSFAQVHEQYWFPSHQEASRDYVQRPHPIDSTSYRIGHVGDDFPSADEHYRTQKLQEQQEQQRQGPKPAPPSPTASLISTYGQKPMHGIPYVRDELHHNVRGHRTARRNPGLLVWAERKPSVSRPTPQKKTSNDEGGCCLVM